MSYIGRVEQKASDIRRFNVTGSTSATHTLTWSPPNEQSLIITINGVKQQEDAYSVSGTTLTLTSPLVSSDKMEVIGIQDVGETMVPGTGVILNEHVNDSAAIALSKLSTTGTPSSSNYLRGDGAWSTISEYDDSGLQGDIAILGFKVAANGSLGKYDLVDQTIDDFQDASGIDASASTGENRSGSNYYFGGTAGNATGGTITTSGSNTIHTFNTAGNGSSTNDFVTPSSGSVDYLVVAGGGGGGNSAAGGGGGGGGVRTGTGFSVSAQTYAIVAGAGATAIASSGNRGSNSSFSTISATGGGGGAIHVDSTNISGGSGGGGSYDQTGWSGSGNAGGYSPVEGYDGGQGGQYSGGGGGGASEVGESMGGTSGQQEGGDGGDGVASSITGASVTYGGGGGGATHSSSTGTYGNGGAGGGGNGAKNGTGVDGTDGLGGGGGGSSNNNTGSAGGNGVVVIAYTTDSFISPGGDMSLVSTSTTAQATPTTGDIVMTYTNGAGTATVNTDLKAYVSRDNGTTWTQATLSSEGTTGGHTILTAHNVDISSQPSGTSMRYKIETLNQSASKETRIQAVSLGWA